jgi:hypothetical protein
MGDELGSVVETRVDRCRALGGDLVQACHPAVGVNGSFDLDGQTLPGELVDDVEQLEGPPVSGLVELEVEGSDDIGPDRAQRPATSRPVPPEGLLVLLAGHMPALVPPQALDPFVLRD